MLKMQHGLLSVLEIHDTTSRRSDLSPHMSQGNALLYVSNQEALIELINHPCQAFY